MAHQITRLVRSLNAIIISALCIQCLCLVGPAAAATIGNSDRGLAYARKVCAECHLVENNGPYSPNPDAPTFQEIANTPGMTGLAIAVWLQTSHPTMPDLIIPQQDTDDLIAYITTMKSN